MTVQFQITTTRVRELPLQAPWAAPNPVRDLILFPCPTHLIPSPWEMLWEVAFKIHAFSVHVWVPEYIYMQRTYAVPADATRKHRIPLN